MFYKFMAHSVRIQEISLRKIVPLYYEFDEEVFKLTNQKFVYTVLRSVFRIHTVEVT